uniref:Secreted protein n=1 Tax=Plectus sambesii TaxID=2011161 RepID=A0A914UWW5_9BILA
MKLLIFCALLELGTANLLFSTLSQELPRLDYLMPFVEDDVDIDACIVPKLYSCQARFNLLLNISGNADWTAPDVLGSAIDGYLLAGVDGLLQVCDARIQFYQCLGSTYRSCINRMYFLSQGYTMKASMAYVEIMKELEFTCDGGLLQAIRSWPCILTVADQSNGTFYSCLAAFNQSVTAHPDSLCTAAQTLTTCMSAPFLASCGDQVGWWECERVRVSLELISSCPSLTCSIGSGGSRSFSKGVDLIYRQIAEGEDEMEKKRSLSLVNM